MTGAQKYGGGVPREFLTQLRDAADLASLVGERVQLKRRGDSLFGLCPFHAEKTPSFSVHPAKGFYHCFGCGASGDALSFVMHTETGGDFMAGVEALASRLGMTVPRGESSAADSVGEVLAKANEFFRREFSRSEVAKKYMLQRGVQDETLANFGIGFAPPGWRNLRDFFRGMDESLLIRAGLLRANEKGAYDYFRERVMFPIMEGAGRIVGFGGRALDADEPAKYLNSPDTPLFSKKNSVFGIPQARTIAREKNRVIITEGYMDVLLLAQNGFCESVAVMGTALTPRQIKKIARMADNLIFALDGDEAGQKAAWRALPGILPSLADGMSAAFLFLPPGEDPDSFVRKNGKEFVENALSEAMPLGDYVAKTLQKNAAAGTAEGRAGWILAEGDKLARLLDSERAPFLREVLSQKFSAAAGVSAAAVRRISARRESQHRAGNARYKMRETDLLFDLLCSVAARPKLLANFSDNPPLSGNLRESAVVAEMLNYARTQLDAGEEPDIIAHLAEEGYAELSRQVRETARMYYSTGGADPEKAFVSLAEKLERRLAQKVAQKTASSAPDAV